MRLSIPSVPCSGTEPCQHGRSAGLEVATIEHSALPSVKHVHFKLLGWFLASSCGVVLLCAGAWCLWNQAQEAEHLAEFGPGEDMMFINDLCGEQDRKKIKTMRERYIYIYICYLLYA